MLPSHLTADVHAQFPVLGSHHLEGDASVVVLEIQ